uniref:BESS domain-containing protein n=1 Tax=Schizaphis graminum TaxID=13262 RepID=A0A2S2NK26_SCHGA
MMDVKKKKKYVYADALTFLQHTIQKRKTSGNVISTENSFQEILNHDDVDIENTDSPRNIYEPLTLNSSSNSPTQQQNSPPISLNTKTASQSSKKIQNFKKYSFPNTTNRTFTIKSTTST